MTSGARGAHQSVYRRSGGRLASAQPRRRDRRCRSPGRPTRSSASPRSEMPGRSHFAMRRALGTCCPRSGTDCSGRRRSSVPSGAKLRVRWVGSSQASPRTDGAIRASRYSTMSGRDLAMDCFSLDDKPAVLSEFARVRQRRRPGRIRSGPGGRRTCSSLNVRPAKSTRHYE